MRAAQQTRNLMMTLAVQLRNASIRSRLCENFLVGNNTNQEMEDAVMAKYHVGVDYHKKFSYIVVKDDAGKSVRSGQVLNQRKSVEDFLEPFSEDAQAVLEATRNWTVMHDWLEEIVDDVKLANPIKVKAIAEAKIKTDKIDATILSDLLRADLIPEAHVPSLKARTMRLALRQRMFFVRIRTMAKNRIYTIFDRYPEQKKELELQ